MNISSLKVQMFADGADLTGMLDVYRQGIVKGFTTNPTLMKKAGVRDYKAFARSVLASISDFPISFEVFSDDFVSMEREAMEIAGWGKNVNVKIPITNTKGESSAPLIKKLTNQGVYVNVTAILTLEQVKEVARALNPHINSIVSVFAGRIANTGRDPMPFMKESVRILKDNPNAKVLWASTRELFNIFQADECGCHIITVTNDILKNLPMVGQDLNELSLETVKMFHKDAVTAGFSL